MTTVQTRRRGKRNDSWAKPKDSHGRVTTNKNKTSQEGEHCGALTRKSGTVQAGTRGPKRRGNLYWDSGRDDEELSDPVTGGGTTGPGIRARLLRRLSLRAAVALELGAPLLGGAGPTREDVTAPGNRPTADGATPDGSADGCGVRPYIRATLERNSRLFQGVAYAMAFAKRSGHLAKFGQSSCLHAQHSSDEFGVMPIHTVL